MSRSANSPVAGYAEWLVARKLRLRLAANSTAGFDATDRQGKKVEIKARRQTPTSRPSHFSALRGLEEKRFDYLIAVLFDQDYSVVRAIRLPYKAVRRLARFRRHVNGSVLIIRDLWNAANAQDITRQLRGDGG
ncbi:MAG: hypothetical protein Q8Q85_14690 [Gemmatimonadales bacterium]|nr:hypothetical protein [Gemmatimonadales bacterium]